MTPSLYTYKDPVAYLGALLEEKKRRNPSYSLRAWSKELGFNNPSTLSAVLNGRRSLKPHLAARIAEAIGLRGDDQKFFELLVLIKNARDVNEQEVYLELLDRLKPGGRYFTVEVETFRLIADWYHLTILEMTHLEGFGYEPERIAESLAGNVSASAVEVAIERLLRMGLLEHQAGGRLVKTTDELFIGDEVPSEAVKSHHRQMLERASEALEYQPMAERDFRGTSIPVRLKDVPKVFELIKKFHDQIHAFACHEDGDEVYRFNSQCFRLTRWRSVEGESNRGGRRGK